MDGQRFDIDGATMVSSAAALDALQEMCRRDCDFRHGYYDPMGSKTLHDALAVLVDAGRLEWVEGPGLNGYRMAKDKEA